METRARELDDRWILPLRGSLVTEVGWGDRVRFRLDPPGEIAVGPGALLTKGPFTAPGAEVTTLGELGPDGSQRAVGARIRSAVAFKSGALRIVLDNGWHLNVRAAGTFVPASVTVCTHLTWSRNEAGGLLSARSESG